MKKILLLTLLFFYQLALAADNDDGCKVYLCLSSTGGGEECTTRIAALALALYVCGARLPVCKGHDYVTILDEDQGMKPAEAMITLNTECCPDDYAASQKYTLTAPRGTYSGECP